MANVIASQVSLQKLANKKPWLCRLPGGLPSDFDYRNVRSAGDAKALMFELPGCDRAKAAVDLYHHRNIVGAHTAYIGIMLAWTHDSRQLSEAFGSAKQFINALTSVAPTVQSPDTKPIEIWRGTLLNRTTPITHSFGLSWSRSRDVACWFALREYVPALQPALAPVVLHACFNRSVILARHNARAELEVIIDVTRQPWIDGMINFDGTDASGPALQRSVTDLCLDRKIFDYLIADWRLAASRYEQGKNLLRTRAYSGRLQCCSRPHNKNPRETGHELANLPPLMGRSPFDY
jgi:hypothetical protein